jgi:hypothetical protein
MQYGWLLAFCSDSHTRIQPQPEHWLQPLAPQALLAYHQPAGTTQPAIGTYISVKLHTPERQLRLAIPVIMYGCHLAFTWHSRILTHLADIAAKPIAKRTLIAHNCKYIKARASEQRVQNRLDNVQTCSRFPTVQPGACLLQQPTVSLHRTCSQ